ncbi:hypothetical protein, partial [Sulfurimonas sp.]
MYKKIFQILVFFITFSTAIYAANTNNKVNYQQQIFELKLEIEKLKQTQNLHTDKKIDDLEKALKELEIRINKTLDKDIAVQDKRINDINERTAVRDYITMWLGIVITILLVGVSVATYISSSNKVKDWLDERAKKKLDPLLKEYLKQVKIKADESLAILEKEGQKVLNEIDNKAEEQRQKHDKEYKQLTDTIKSLTTKTSEEIEAEAESLGEDDSKYTFSQWYTKFLQKYKQNEFVDGLVFLENALQKATSQQEKIDGLFAKGVTLGTLERSEEEIEVYDQVIKEFRGSKNEVLLEQVAKAMVNKGVRLGTLERSEEAIEVYDQVIKEFRGSK